jgi:Winged helix-turn helix
MKVVKELLNSELVTLQEAQKHAPKHHFRTRCQAIELSSRGKSVTYIADLLCTRPDTVYTWIRRWEAKGIVGLMILPGRGLKAKLDIFLSKSGKDSVDLIKKK